jgi:hypothetical protein
MIYYDALIHLSGGMDSTFVLWDYLKHNPDKRILVHHVKLRHLAEDRLELEQAAVENIVAWLKIRGMTNFDYHESRFEYGTLPRISVKDIQIVAFFTAIILRTKNFKGFRKLLLSWHKGEVDDVEINRGARIKKVLEGLEVENIPRFVFPIAQKTRADMAKVMPADLLDLVWVCRKPKDGKKCLRCKICLEMIEAGIF